MSASTIFAEDLRNPNPEAFDSRFTSGVNHGGAQITASVGYSSWHGSHDVIVRSGNPMLGGIFYFAPHEARDLAKALLALATHAEEEDGRTRSTELGTEEAGR